MRGDLNDSLGDRLSAISTLFTLPAWGLLHSDSILTASSSTKGWDFAKGRDTSDCKNFPPTPPDYCQEAIAVWNSDQKSRPALLPPTLLLCATASALRYIVFSRILASVCNRLFGIPLIDFHDDLRTPTIADLAHGSFCLIPDVSGFPRSTLNSRKCERGGPMPFLGLLAPHRARLTAGDSLFRLSRRVSPRSHRESEIPYPPVRSNRANYRS